MRLPVTVHARVIYPGNARNVNGRQVASALAECELLAVSGVELPEDALPALGVVNLQRWAGDNAADVLYSGLAAVPRGRLLQIEGILSESGRIDKTTNKPVGQLRLDIRRVKSLGMASSPADEPVAADAWR